MVAKVKGLNKYTADAMERSDLSLAEKQLRDRFVDEYLKDYNPYAAAIRVGFAAAFAEDWYKKFMQESYVLNKIKQVELNTDNDYITDTNKKMVISALLKEANYHGAGSSHSARVTALSKLASLYDMDKPVKTETTINAEIPAVQLYLPDNGRLKAE